MDQPLRILYLQSTSEIGGSDIALLRMVETLDRERFKPYVALPSEGPLVDSFRRLGCEVLFVPEMLKLTSRRGLLYPMRYLLNYPRAVWKLYRLIRELEIDLVHTNSLHNLYGFLAARLAGVPHVWHAWEIVVQSDWIRRLEVFLAEHFASAIVAPSSAIAEMFSAKASPLLRRIPGSVDTQEFHPRNDGGRVRDPLSLGARNGAPIVGTVCRLDHWKGIDAFLRSCAIVRESFPEACFLVVGGAIEGQESYVDELRKLAETLGLAGAVHFTGWRYGPAEMPSVHAALDVLVLASTWPEPFGQVLIEAMASGKPVVATAHGGPLDICVDGETGLLVPPRDDRALAEAVTSLLGDSSRARAMGEAGRRRAETLFDRAHWTAALESLYLELCPARGRIGALAAASA